MVTKRYIRREGKTFGPYYYESYRDSSGKVKKRYMKNYNLQKNNNNLTTTLTIIGLILIFTSISIILSQELSHKSLTGRAIYETKEIYSLGEPLAGDILFNLMKGESIPTETLVKISLGDFQEEFTLSDFVDYQPVQGTIYAENSELSGEGMVFGIPGEIYQEVEFELKIYMEQSVVTKPRRTTSAGSGTASQPKESPATSPAESPKEPSKESPTETTTAAPVTGKAVTEIITKTISGTTSKGSPFTYQLEDGQKARIVDGSVKSNNKEISENEISLDTTNNVLTVTTEYAIEGFGKEFLGKENAMTFKINIADLGLEATSGELVIEISYDGKQIAYYEDTILVSETEEILLEPTITQIQEIPSIRIPSGENENVVIDLQDYFTGATWYSAKIENIQVNVEGSLMQLSPDPEFKGARKAKIIAGNEKETLESNEFLILVSSGAITIKTTREKIMLGQPVKWKKEITKEQAEEKINIEIPREAGNVEVKAIVEEQEKTIEKIEGSASSLTGNVVIEVKLDEKNQKANLNPKFLKSFKTWFTSFKVEFNKKLQIPPEFTGKTIEEIPPLSEVVDIALKEPGTTNYIIEYETPAPESTEQETEKGKIVTITAPSEFGYTNVIAFTELANTVPITQSEKIEIYWYNYEYQDLTEQEIQKAKTTEVAEVPAEEVVEEISTVEESPLLTGNVISTSETESSTYIKQQVVFDAYDVDGDGMIDYLEWVVPHLSNQTYEIVIVITNAEHLDENRTFISDIYENVSSLDNIWSETIPENHFVRITFEQNLTSENDITLFPRTINGTPQIEVYEQNGTEIIATFTSLADNEYNKVYLTNLQESQKTFDLRIINGAIEFDHIIDPTDGAPRISFSSDTTPAGTQSNNNIFINLTTNDSSTHYSFVDFNNDVVLWMRMDDTNSSGDPTDLSSYSNNGSKQGNAVQNSSGYFGESFTFDGNGDSVSVSSLNNGAKYEGGNFTLSIWIYPTNNGVIISDYNSWTDPAPAGKRGWKLEVVGTSVNYTINGNDGIERSSSIVTSSGLTLNSWSHIVVVDDGETAITGANTTIYINGIASKNGTRGLMSADASRAFRVGASNADGPAADFFNGSIDELIIFNRSLSATEVAALYNSSANQYSNNFTNLAEETYIFQGFAVDTAGNKNQTSTRTVIINSSYQPDTPPSINFTLPTPANGSTQNSTSIFVNLSTNDSSTHYSFVDFNRDVMLWMRMDDTNSSGDPTDISSYSSNGSKQGNAIQNSSGYFNSSFNFDGSGDYIAINKLFDLSRNVTYSVWVKPLAGTGNLIFSQINSLAGSPRLFISNGKVVFYPSNGTEQVAGIYYQEIFTSSLTVTVNNWSHIVIDYNLTGASIYINGVKDPSVIHTSGSFTPSAYFNFSIGRGDADYFNGSIDELIIFNRSLSQQEVLALYNASANQYYKNFTNLANGTHTFQGFAVDIAGNKNQTSTRTVIINLTVITDPPSIEYIQPTPNDRELTDNPNITIKVNVTTYNSTTLGTLRYRIYDSSVMLVNETYTTSLNLTLYNLPIDTYTYHVWVNDSENKNDTTADRSITIIRSCFNLTTECTEGLTCTANENCYLYSGMCSDNDCSFTLFTVNATIYTLYDTSGNARDLKLTLTSNSIRAPLTFLNGSMIVFSGRNGTSLGSGSEGGSGGTVNITVSDLFNTTNARFIGQGGYTTQINSAGGNGGNLILNFHGLIRNFTNTNPVTPAPNLLRGDSVSGIIFGNNGQLIYNKDLNTCPRDVDIDGDGKIAGPDRGLIHDNYNNETGDRFNNYNINCDGKINVIDLSRVGFEWDTR